MLILLNDLTIKCFHMTLNIRLIELVIYGNGMDITSEFQSKDDYNRTIADMQFTRENKSQIVTLDLISLGRYLNYFLFFMYYVLVGKSHKQYYFFSLCGFIKRYKNKFNPPIG